ncbi:sulfotransferase family protein [Sulfitobacter sp. SK012]|uniref:sulfotransferase-like domain-containing protein n=1 Tax=Sulfitobacter sp. SK012 TaxID=1389005 RepID=UPI000E0C3C2E|nr:HAD family hydrolase [Sulfitobacter sp. SK012]AXI44774.1 sulfotransferase family protein [Sulfitobacter sp. SK012]
MKIAMWSGPRNLSTAMMYSFGNRPDFEAMDEPFYAPYLMASGITHPMRAQIVTAHETDPDKVAAACAAAPAQHRYMKHMPHHMLDGIPLEWAKNCINIHLIRHPARVIASYTAKRENPTLEDIGYAQQTALYEKIGGLVIDSHDIRENPEAALRSLCNAIDLPFLDTMLEWPTGPKPFDGVWASHWYGAVHHSTGFAGPEGARPQLEGAASALCKKALPHYEFLKARKLSIGVAGALGQK